MVQTNTIGDLVANTIIDTILELPVRRVLVPVDFDHKAFVNDLTTNAFGQDIPFEELGRARVILDRAIHQGDDARLAAGRAYSYLMKYFDAYDSPEEADDG